MYKAYINNGWFFNEKFNYEMLKADYDMSGFKPVRLPHTCKELPYHYFDENDYQMVCTYRRSIWGDESWEGLSVLLTFEGVAHDCTVYLNGKNIAKHHCGYTAFTVDISRQLNYGEDNVLVVKADSRESLNVPPFGFVIDYMTYGGIYRDVYIDIRPKTYMEDIFVETRLAEKEEISDGDKTVFVCNKSALVSHISIKNAMPGLYIRQTLFKKGENQGRSFEDICIDDIKPDEDGVYTITQNTGRVELWDTENPAMYTVNTQLIDAGVSTDISILNFGYRKAVFHKDGFYLNGRKLKIMGLNRHQSYPYVGYAMPESMQKYDADILKYELGVNAVRTSHYPQSQYFIDRCDELGLLVFTELPGWQHIGDADWKKQAVQNVSDMVKQYRNHASIVLWGVRINESVDDDEFYEETNRVAHLLDPTRQTGGVRCYKKGNLQEDVFTYNDFLHNGKAKGCDKKSAVTSDMEKPYLVSEYNGHMYPSKAFDWEEHRTEHALRHANVLDEVANQEDIAGSFGWCMFDYNTHKDFGSGDRICYHGVMDMFRNPKLAAFVYASQQDETPVLELSSSMDIGEHPGCNRGDMYIITNADSVKMYKNGKFIKEYKGEDSKYTHLKHGPILIDDYIGDALIENEDMKEAQARDVKALLNEVAKVGLYNLSKAMYAKAGKLMLLYHMKMSDAVELYNRYVGDWGGESTEYRFDAIKDGEIVKSVIKKPMKKVYIKATPSHTELHEGLTYDVAEIRITAVDENGNVLPYFNDVVSFKTEGPLEIIGPKTTVLHGGMGGTYVKTMEKHGSGRVIISSPYAEDVVIEMEVK